MTRKEEISKAYTKYAQEGGILQSNPWFAFEAGANWADSHPINVWHDASEEPKDSSKILIYFLNEYGKMTYRLYHYIYWSNLSWEEVVDLYNIKQWAYPDDLLPKN